MPRRLNLQTCCSLFTPPNHENTKGKTFGFMQSCLKDFSFEATYFFFKPPNHENTKGKTFGFMQSCLKDFSFEATYIFFY
jgi:hypothetical protein